MCGLYGVDLHRAQQQHKYADSKWVYAEVVGALSALTALLYLVPFVLRFAAVWVWSAVLFVLWITLFGLFGNMYIRENPEGNADIQRMKNAVWVDPGQRAAVAGGHARGAGLGGTASAASRFTGRAKV